MNPASYAIRNRVVTFVLIVLVVAGGLLSFFKLGRLEDPEFTIKEAVIYTQYPGATAEQVELEVTEPIETAIQQLKQLKEVRSISRVGVSIIIAEIKETYDKDTLPQVWDELRRKVSQTENALPPGCGNPSVNDDFGDVYGVLFALTGDGYSTHELNEIAKDLRRELLLCKDVGRIDFWGKQQEVVYIEIDRAKLAKLGMEPSTIFDAISQENLVTPTGKVAVGSEDIGLRVSGDYSRISDLENQLISGGNGRMIVLKDVAIIHRGYVEPPVELLRWNGQPAVCIGISTVSGGDVIAMGGSISKRLDELKTRMPLGVELHSIVNQSETVKEAVDRFIVNLVAAVAIVILFLIIFMGVHEGFIVGAVLLLTIFATFVGMKVMDVTLQRISLGALIIALGMLVDNAIVIVEGIVIKTQNGIDRERAVQETVREAQWPLLGATGIAILAFAAITLSKDMTGEWLKSLFQVICLSLGLSWVFAITVTPLLCVSFLPDVKLNSGHSREIGFYRYYKSFLKGCIDHRYLSLMTVVLLLGIAMWGFGYVRQDFMPDMNRPQITVDVWLPEGSHIDQTEKEVTAISNYVKEQAGVTQVVSFIGRGPLRFLLTYEPEMANSAYGQLLVSLDTYERIPQLRQELTKYLERQHSRAITSVDAFKLGPGGGAVVARISGPDANVMRALGEKVKSIMRENKNTRSVRTDWGQPVKVQSVQFAEARARSIGVTRPDLSQSLLMNFSGANVGVYRNKEDLLPIILRPPLKQRNGIENLNDIQVWNASRDRWVPIDQVSDGHHLEWETPAIFRLNRHRVLRVICKQRAGTTDGLWRQLKDSVENMKLPVGYTLEWGGEHEEQIEANSKLMANMPIAFMAMFVISVLLFNSLRHPLIIFMGLPLAVIGVASGMLLADKPFGFMAMLGFLSLFGMLIKNEIVLLEQINLERVDGKHPYHAVVEASVSRIRPVCMAAFTTVLGMIPLLWDAFFAPMAVTIMGGLTFATVLTLIVVPVLYCTLFNIRKAEVYV